MSQTALETLIYSLHETNFPFDGRILFVNARDHAALRGDITNVQWFYPYAQNLEQQVSRIEDVDGAYDALFMLWPKNRVEGEYLFARGLSLLKEGAPFFVSAENKAGGSRLHKIVQQFCASELQQFSKHKCRLVHGVKGDVNTAKLDQAIEDGTIKTIDSIGFTSQAGIYGWSKIDAGSKLLLQHIPQDLTGTIADFGCGYGYLLQHILQHNKGIKTAYAIDADARALVCCEANLSQLSSCGLTTGSHTKQTDPAIKSQDDISAIIEHLWRDLTKPQNLPPLDIIIMNPPFHEGKTTDTDIGAAFIKTAAQSLKSGGRLYMVANTQLPYEVILETHFSTHTRLAQNGGFKVFDVIK